MSKRQWTPQQQNAINSRGGTLLLSAAAGSGKTAVLVERIVKLLTEGNEPVEPSQLLVVTFTNAAAAEMRTRINNAISELIEENPGVSLYRNVRMKLPEAQISTIDSFCIRLVRENFHMAEIEPDFRLLDDSEQRILVSEAMEKTLDDLCSNAPDAYDMLNSMTSYNRDDSDLSSKILRLYNFSLSHPFPFVWLDNTEKMYCENDDLKSTVWGEIILKNGRITVDYCKQLIDDGLEIIENCPPVSEKYNNSFIIAADKIQELSQSFNDGWNEIYGAVREFSLDRLPTAPRGYGQDPSKLVAEMKYKKVNELISKTADSFCATEEEHIGDMSVLFPVMKELIATVRDFSSNYDELKQNRNGYTFTDIMHKALNLLVKYENGKAEKTSLAYSLSQQYREILIDEYQDTNEAQDMLFRMLSREEKNLFMVGDVKQSIYRFRLAMPEIFVKKSHEFSDYDGETYPAKVILGKNFRSRKGVLDNINFLFSNLMSDYAGEMTYGKDEALYFGDGYNEDTEPAAELRFFEGGSTEKEAEYIASLIKKMIYDGVEVTEKDKKRKARFSDFCILLRSTKGKSDVYEKVLSDNGVSVYGERKAGLFDTTEISVFMSLLKAIDNPTDDVSMLSVMMSPLYGFTADEVADMKIPNKKLNMFTCLTKASESNQKAKLLLKELDSYRHMAAVMPFDVFIRSLLDSTGFASSVSALKHGETRRMNLIILCELAGNYMNNGGTGLSGFIRYFSRAVENGAQIPTASDISSDADVVRIYSIHKSKGLEFPFVIIADCAKKFNNMDIIDDMIISPTAGVGMVVINNEKLQKYPSVCHSAAKIAIKRATMSEELRILYVAMTRAKEKVIMVSSLKDINKEIFKTAAEISVDGKVSPAAVIGGKSYMNLLLMGYLSHPDMAEISKEAGVVRNFSGADSRMKIIVDCPEEKEESALEYELPVPNNDIIKELKEHSEFVYPYRIPENARPKRVASDFEDNNFSAEFFAKSKPSFLYDEKLTPAQIGTANHLFLQCCDMNLTSVESEVNRLVEQGILTPKQGKVIRINKMEKFFDSELFKRIKNADKVYREKEFTVEVSLGEIEPSVDKNVKDEKILILGKTDIVFVENGEAVVADYKTDRSKDEESFKAAYRGQLEMYKTAAERMLGIPVKETLIYSLNLEKTITL